MKKFVLTLICIISAFGCFAQERSNINVNAGFLFPSTLNATVGYEHHLWDGNYGEIFGEMGNHWMTGKGNFWKGYYWDFGLTFKYRMKEYKNGNLYFRIGPQVGAVQRKVAVGFDVGIEYNYVFSNGIIFSVIEKNDFNFIHGDTFRNGLLIGVKIPFR